MTLHALLVLAALTFSIGVFGLLTRRNAIAILISLDLITNAANLNLVAFSRMGNPYGQAFTLMSIAIAVAEIAIALAIVILLFARFGHTETDKMDTLHG